MDDGSFERLKERVAADLTPEQRMDLLGVVQRAIAAHMAETVVARGAAMVVEAHACRHCGHTDVVRHGRDAAWRQRFRCRRGEAGGCDRTFNGLTRTALARMRKPEAWAPFTAAMAEHRSLSRTAQVADVARLTAFRWRHRLLDVQAVREAQTVGGVVEADETFFRDSFKGSRGWKRGQAPAPRMRGGGASLGPGLTAEYVPVLTALDRAGGVVEAVLPGHGSIAEALTGRPERGSVLCSDGLAAYRHVAEASGSEHRRIAIPKKDWLDRALGEQPRQEGALGLGRVNQHHRTLKATLNLRANGVSTAKLPGYLGWLRAMRRNEAGPKNLVFDPLIYRFRPEPDGP